MSKSIVTGMFAVGLAAWGSADMANGPGGRIYFAGRANGSDYTVMLKSAKINPDWTMDGAVETHGTTANTLKIIDDGWGVIMNRCSPEIDVPAGTGYAQLAMGLKYNNTPASTYTAYNYMPSQETLDILRLEPNVGSLTVTVLGDGRTMAAGGSTDCGQFALPDPAKGFVGPSGGYLTQGQTANSFWDCRWVVCRNGGGSSDVTDNDADYTAVRNTSQPEIAPFDAEIVGNRMYWIKPWEGVWYLDNAGNLAKFAGGGSYPNSRLAAGRVTVDGQQHDAVWYWLEARKLILAVDKNDDGDAQDEGESAVAYESAIGDWYYSFECGNDMELVTGNDGSLFLLETSLANAYGANYILVMELNADGTKASTPLTRIDCSMAFTGGGVRLPSFEFDAAQPPPPPPGGTLVLLK